MSGTSPRAHRYPPKSSTTNGDAASDSSSDGQGSSYFSGELVGASEDDASPFPDRSEDGGGCDDGDGGGRSEDASDREPGELEATLTFRPQERSEPPLEFPPILSPEASEVVPESAEEAVPGGLSRTISLGSPAKVEPLGEEELEAALDGTAAASVDLGSGLGSGQGSAAQDAAAGKPEPAPSPTAGESTLSR